MKKISLIILIAFFAGLMLAATVKAEEGANSALGNPGILPTNPFYFLKEWTRGIKKFFTKDPVKKIDLEIDEANERAAEIKKMEEVDSQNSKAILRALDNYTENISRLKIKLETPKEVNQNKRVDKLLEKLAERSLKQRELFDDLKANLARTNTDEILESVVPRLDPKSEIAETIKKADEKTEEAKEAEEHEAEEYRAVKENGAEEKETQRGETASSTERNPEVEKQELRKNVDSSSRTSVQATREGFTPLEIKIKKGDKVTWINKSDQEVWPASGNHPTHTIYPEFDPRRGIKPGEEWSLVFDKTGNWGYHDHLNPRMGGVVKVSE
ncbi:hypothetical protein HYV91_00795 [Candidatus Wolfebacteria bacterium]|nr:hypothetical protein [Candidatus Wolfebacteria bacterium]